MPHWLLVTLVAIPFLAIRTMRTIDVKRRYLAFDIETAKEIPGADFNWKPHRPLGIACAATHPSDSDEPALWYGRGTSGAAGDRMAASEAKALLTYLVEMAASGYTVLTWNGLAFDLDILGEESGSVDACRTLAREHVDMMFHVVCAKGFPVSLENAAKGMAVPGKSVGITGEKAPQLWRSGRREEVLEYVSQDVRAILGVAAECEKQGVLRWVTRKGTLGEMPLRDGWLLVREANELPEPDTSWMRDPPSREKYTGWLR